VTSREEGGRSGEESSGSGRMNGTYPPLEGAGGGF